MAHSLSSIYKILGPCDQFLGPFRGSCCEKTPKIAQNHFSWTVWPNYDWKPFLFYFSYEIRIVDCLFNVFIFYPGLCDHFLDPFRGSCCVKITKNSSKSTFLKLFDLIMTGNFVYFLFSYEICFVDCFFDVFICHSGPCDPYLDPFRGLCYVKMTNINISCTFWHLVFKTLPRDPGIAGLFF